MTNRTKNWFLNDRPMNTRDMTAPPDTVGRGSLEQGGPGGADPCFFFGLAAGFFGFGGNEANRSATGTANPGSTAPPVSVPLLAVQRHLLVRRSEHPHFASAPPDRRTRPVPDPGPEEVLLQLPLHLAAGVPLCSAPSHRQVRYHLRHLFASGTWWFGRSAHVHERDVRDADQLADEHLDGAVRLR